MSKHLYLLMVLLAATFFIMVSCTDDTTNDENTDGDVTDGDVADGDILDGDVLDGDITDGDVADGDATDGDVADGDATDGDITDGDTSDGDVTDGDVSDGDTTDGDTSDGDVTDGDVTDGDISDGDVTDGDVTDGDVSFSGYRVAVLHQFNGGDETINELSFYSLSESGEWTALQVGIPTEERLSAAIFTADASQLVVGHEGGEITTYGVIDGQISELQTVTTDRYVKALRLQGEEIWILDGNPADYDGGTQRFDPFADPPAVSGKLVSLHAPSGLTFHPDGRWAVAFAGRNVGDVDDMAVFDTTEADPTPIFSDHWESYSNAYRADFSPDGTRLAGGNDSLFAEDANVVKLFSFDADTGALAELDNVDVETPVSCQFSDDGMYLYVSAVEADRIMILSTEGDTLSLVDSVSGMGLVAEMQIIREGPLSGHLLAATYNALVLFAINGDGTLEEVSRARPVDDGAYELIDSFTIGHQY